MTQRAGHLVPVDDGWTVWRWVCLRGAGFPARQVLELAAPEIAQLVDRLLDLEEARERARVRAVDALGAVQRSRPVNRAIKRLERGEVPALSDRFGDAQPAVEACIELDAELSQSRETLARAYAAGEVRIAGAVADIARRPRFREALLWQNRRAVRGSVASLLRRPPTAVDARTREQRRLVASYLQRYCVKNDTIGFFGPVGWATAGAGVTETAVRPGPGLLASRRVYFEHWAIDALAAEIATDDLLKPHLEPRRRPTVRIDGVVLHLASGKPFELPLTFARALAACDGERTAIEIARALIADPEIDFGEEDEVFAVLEQLEHKQLITWSIEIPTAGDKPEDALRRALEAAGSAGRGGLERLRALEASRDEVAASAGDPDALDAALASLESSFAELTGRGATRSAGQMYAGRTVVYEDCRRDLDVVLGDRLMTRLAAPLALVLASARWYTHRIAELFRRAFDEVFARVARPGGAVDYLTFWDAARELFAIGGRSPLVARACGELERAWGEIFAIDPRASRADYRSRDLRDPVAAAFAAPHAGWPSALYHSPDILIAATDTEAVARGDYLLVLGELHPTANTTAVPVFLDQHQEPAALIRAREIDLPEPAIVPVIGKEQATRADHVWLSAHNIDLELGATRSWRPRSQVAAAASLVVERERELGNLVVGDREGRWRFDVIRFFDYHLTGATGPYFDLLDPATHAPRLTIDDVVVRRETWRFDPAQLDFPGVARGAEQLARARRWARDNNLPRFVFAKLPEERKPVYVDLDSPIYVEQLAKLSRKASALTISEMLPTVEQCWLPDAERNRYASELRFVAVDPKPWRPPGGAS